MFDYKKIKNKFNFVSAILLLLFIINFILFAHIDIAIIGTGAFVVSEGNILNFYDESVKNNLPQSYPIPTFLIYGLWNKIGMLLGLIQNPGGPLTGFYSLWYKILTLIFYILTFFEIKNIFKQNKICKINNKNIVLYLFSSPWITFSVIIFSQVDILGIYFFVLGLKFLFKNKVTLGSLIIGLSFSFKPFLILAFMPIILSFEKNIFKIIKTVILGLAPYLIISLLYLNSQGYITHVIGFGALKKVLMPNISGTKILILPFLYLLIFSYIYVFFKKNNFALIFFSISLCYGILFSLIDFYPQWLIYFGIFFSLTCIFLRFKTLIFIFESFSFYLYLSYIVNYFKGNVDNMLITWGPFNSRVAAEISMNNFFVGKILANEISFSLFGGSLIFLLILAYYFITNINNKKRAFIKELSLNDIIKLRFLVAFTFFLLPASLCIAPLKMKLLFSFITLASIFLF
jgi:hypothetical protein